MQSVTVIITTAYMKKILLALTTSLISFYVYAVPDFCTVEIRKCGGALSDNPVRCGYKGKVAFVNCGTDDIFKLDGKFTEDKVKAAMKVRDMTFVKQLNKKLVYARKKIVPTNDPINFCYAELKITQIGSTFFKPQHLLATGYSVECTEKNTDESMTMGEIKNYTAKHNGNDDNLSEIKPITKSLTSAMTSRGYKMAQYLPLNFKEQNNFPFSASGMMFGDGDHRFTGYIFQK